MGRKKHSLGSAFGKGKLESLTDQVHEDDGRRFTDGKDATHKGLGTKAKYKKPKHKGKGWGLNY